VDMTNNPVLNKLLVQSIEATSSSSNANRAPLAPMMDPERRKWLEDALKEVTYDVTEKLKEYIEIIRNPDGKKDDTLCEALMGLQFECEQIDAANDLYKLQGTEPVINLLTHKNNEVRKHAAWVLATCMNQNPVVHQQVEQYNLLPKFLELVQQEEDAEAIQKLLLCISALIRENPREFRQFTDLHGFEVIGKMSAHSASKIRCKAAFMFFALLCQVSCSELEQIASSNHLIAILSDLIKCSLATISQAGQVEEPVATGIQHVLATLCLFLPTPSDAVKAAVKQVNLASLLREVESLASKFEFLKNVLGETLPKSAGFQLLS